MVARAPLAVIRADASAQIGGGHVMRCLALAEELTSRGWAVAFCATPDTFEVVPDLVGFPMSKAIMELNQNDPEKIQRQWPEGADLLVIDHYQLDASFETSMRRFAKVILAIDDFPTRRHQADLLVDTTLGRVSSEYNALLDGKALCGADYALLREPFRAVRATKVKQSELDRRTNRIVVNLGLTDPDNATRFVLESIAGLVPNIDIVLGERAPHREQIAALAAQTEGWAFYQQVSANEMANLLAHAEAVIGAAGVSVYERCCLGKPMFLLQTADNQSGNIDALVDRRIAISLGRFGDISKDGLRTQVAESLDDSKSLALMGTRAALLVDGNGALRIADAVMSL